MQVIMGYNIIWNENKVEGNSKMVAAGGHVGIFCWLKLLAVILSPYKMPKFYLYILTCTHIMYFISWRFT
jgi:hypothetical protein